MVSSAYYYEKHARSVANILACLKDESSCIFADVLEYLKDVKLHVCSLLRFPRPCPRHRIVRPPVHPALESGAVETATVCLAFEMRGEGTTNRDFETKPSIEAFSNDQESRGCTALSELAIDHLVLARIMGMDVSGSLQYVSRTNFVPNVCHTTSSPSYLAFEVPPCR